MEDTTNRLFTNDEKNWLLRFGVDYFNGARVGGLLSGAFFFQQSWSMFRAVKKSFIETEILRGVDEKTALRSNRALRCVFKGLRHRPAYMGLSVIGAVWGLHNTGSAFLAHSRVQEFNSGDIPAWSGPEFRKPTFVDGFVVGVFGSFNDCDCPLMPPQLYFDMRCGY